MNNRRKLVIALGAGALAAPFASFAQQQGKVWRIGILDPYSYVTSAPRVETFRQSLRELGYEEGRNIILVARFAEGKMERFPGFAAELVSLKMDAIVVSSTQGIKAAQDATRTIPIIMTTVGDPIAAGFVVSLARPGGNITGRTILGPELSAKRLQLLKEAYPRVSRVAILWDSTTVHEIQALEEARAASSILGITIQPLEVRRAEEFDAALASILRNHANGLFVYENGTNQSACKRLADFAAQNRLPAIYGSRQCVVVGGMMSYGPVILDNYRRAAVFVDKIFKGAKPADLPVEQPTRFELVINMKTAKALGINIPNSILVRADEVIE